MVIAEDIKQIILSMADQRGSEVFYATEVARQVDPINWKNLMGQVTLVAGVLIKEGKIKSMNSDSQIDLNEYSGPIRLMKA